MFENFFGHRAVTEVLHRIIAQERIPHTLLFHGPEGVGKATLARRVGAALLGDAEKIEQDDLNRPENRERIAEREKLPSNKRSEDPLLFATHPDFITFPPEGPLRQISIPQMRLLKERAQFKPLKGNRRVFLIDRLDRANEQAANSLLKTLEEPPDHLILILTAENIYDLLPTIRSRAVSFYLAPLAVEEMREFARFRELDHAERRIALANGSPGIAVSLDLDAYDHRRAAMLSLLGAASRHTRLSRWAEYAERIGAERTEKLDSYLMVLYQLLEDVVLLAEGREEIRNADIRDALAAVARRVSFEWIRAAVARVDELIWMARRNVQKSIALDALVVELQSLA